MRRGKREEGDRFQCVRKACSRAPEAEEQRKTLDPSPAAGEEKLTSRAGKNLENKSLRDPETAHQLGSRNSITSRMQGKSVQGKMAALILWSCYRKEGDSVVVGRADTHTDSAN